MSGAVDGDCVDCEHRPAYYRTGECLVCYARRRRRTDPAVAERDRDRVRRYRARQMRLVSAEVVFDDTYVDPRAFDADRDPVE